MKWYARLVRRLIRPAIQDMLPLSKEIVGIERAVVAGKGDMLFLQTTRDLKDHEWEDMEKHWREMRALILFSTKLKHQHPLNN